MSATCHPIPYELGDEMLQVVARALCDRPGEKPAQRDSRKRQMVHAIMGAGPRDGLEVMLASLAVGHFDLLLDSMSDALRGQAELLKARTKSTIVSLDRAMVEFLRELRLNQKRPLAPGLQPAEAEHTEQPVAPVPEPRAAEPAIQPAPASGSEPARSPAARPAAAACPDVAPAGPPTAEARNAGTTTAGPEQASRTANDGGTAHASGGAGSATEQDARPPADDDPEALRHTMRLLATLLAGEQLDEAGSEAAPGG